MNTPAPQPPPVQPPPGTIACPRCGAAIGPEQDWCVTCGVAARTRVAPVPHWRRPIFVVATVGAVALATLAVALVSLSATDAPPGAATVTAVTGPPVSETPPAAVPGLESTVGTPTTIQPAVPAPSPDTTGTGTGTPDTTAPPLNGGAVAPAP